MKNFMVKGALCAVLVTGTVCALSEAGVSEERMDRLTKIWGCIAKKYVVATKDKEVIAQNKDCLARAKKMFMLAKVKMQLTADESRELEAFMENYRKLAFDEIQNEEDFAPLAETFQAIGMAVLLNPEIKDDFSAIAKSQFEALVNS